LIRLRDQINKNLGGFQVFSLNRAARPREFDACHACDIDDREIWRFLPELKRRLMTVGG